MKKKIYCLGNSLLKNDSLPLKIRPALVKEFPDIDFVVFDPTEENEISDKPIFLDSVVGLRKIRIFNDLKKFQLSPKNSAHDFDLPVLLGLILKLKKIKSFTIIGVPEKYTVKRTFDEVSEAIKRI